MKLATYIKSKKLTASEFSREIGTSPMAVHRYMIGRLPAPDVVIAIHKATKGVVQPNDFYNLERKR
jgi:transcriptional regulator with XRE-family HTH domain